jgi:hypothetical protein
MKVFVRTLGLSSVDRVEVKDVSLLGILLITDDGQEFTIQDGRGGLRISATDNRLIVEPEASNVIQVSELRE